MLSLNHIALSMGARLLFSNVNLTVYEGQKIGLVGNNGCGKSSLFQLILNTNAPDDGVIEKKPNITISHLAQEVPHSDESALDYVLGGDHAYQLLIHGLKSAEALGDHEDVLKIHTRLEETEGYKKPSIAASILAGLGFTSHEINQPVTAFSGGWRMRLNLARCLMTPADLLLLDEPTNHLDLEAIAWLEKWLKASPSSLLLISHDRDFLDALVSHIAHIESQTLHLYTGNYSQFEAARAEKLAQQQATYEKQQAKIQHLNRFIDRFRAKASKAKQAQSRVKAIERMELVAKAQIDSPFSFSFKPISQQSNPILSLKNANIGYDALTPILNQVNFQLFPGDRIALLGPNGQGKSTFIKALTQSLPLLSGELIYGTHTKIGYFTQHQIDSLDLSLTPIETILSLSPKAREQEVRNFLGGFDFRGDMATTPITHFSGGEKARLALAKLTWLEPNVLMLDEPTNHLDLNMRAALELALETFEGALILISHDRHLLNSSVNDFYLIYQRQVSSFDGTLEDYYTYIQTQVTSAQTKTPHKKKDAIDHRTRKSWQNRLKKLEELEQQYHSKIKAIDLTLTDLSLYEADNLHKLQIITEDKQQLEILLQETETEWLTLFEKLSETE